MAIQNTSTTPSDTYQMRNVNTVRLESRNIAAQPGEVNYKKNEVIAFVVNTGINITANNFYI